MTPKKIYRERPDIEKVVMDKYPTPKKKLCNLDKAKLEGVRWELAKRLYNESVSVYDEPNEIIKGSLIVNGKTTNQYETK